MNRFTIAAGAGAVAVVLAGCGPKLAQVPYGEEEARWQKILRENYSGYEAPRTAAPAVKDNVSPRLIEKEQSLKNEQNNYNPPPPADNPPPADDPALMVDNAANRPAAAQEQAPAAAEQNKKADKPVAEKKAETPAGDKKADKPAAKPAAAESGAPKGSEIYVVKPKDTVGALAQKFYGDANCRDVIIRANPELKKNPDFLKPGMKLVIPKI